LRSTSRRLALLLAAAAAGASGLALETLLLDGAGLALGHGRSTALGLPTFLAAWALGAHRAGRSRGEPSRDLLRAGAAAGLASLPAVGVLLWAGRAPGGLVAPVAALIAIAAAAFAQGLFLAPLARAFGGDVAWLLAANLAGAIAGVEWIADRIVAASGRYSAALAAAEVALAAGIVGALGARGEPLGTAREVRAQEGGIGWRAAAMVVAAATAWVASLEWIGLRLGVLWLGGMQESLRAILSASMVALAAGAVVVPRVVPKGSRGVLAALALCALGGAAPLLAAPALRALGLAASPGGERALGTALVLVGPALLPFGGLLAVLHRALPLESGERLGRLLLHEAWGALLGVPLAHLALVPLLGLGGALAALELLGAAAILALRRALPRAATAGAALPLCLGAWAATRPPPALDSPPLANPAFRVLGFAEDRDFAVTVVDDGIQGERTLLTDGFRAAGTGPEYRYMQVLGHLPVLLSPAPRRVAVLALGTGTTLGAVAQHGEVEGIDVLEISKAVVDAAPWFAEKNRGALASGSRVRVRLGDGRTTLAGARGAYDVITMEPLLPDSPFGVYLYTREFYAIARDALAPGGLLCQWVPPHALEPETFRAVLDAFASAFPWSSVWLSGAQVILLGGEREPALDPLRFPASGALASSLAELGLSTPAALIARRVADGARARGAPRPLVDADPWVIRRPRRRGAVLLADLPRNLAFLRSIGSPPPADWLAAAGPEAPRAIEALAALRGAREAQALAEARMRGGHPGATEVAPRLGDPELAPSLARARELAPGDPEVRDFEGETRFLDELRRGVSLLASDRSSSSAQEAQAALGAAARARPRRGDVHLYAAVALERLGDPSAQGEVAAAIEACPRIADTPEGSRARSLGLSDAAWSRAQAAARTEREFFRDGRFGKSAGVVTSDPP